jgi:UDP-N-acetylmuramate dehydrogenase
LVIVLENIPLAPLTTLGVGGPSRYFVEAASAEEVCEAVGWARARQLPLFVLGGGSNLVVADAGFPGLVLKVGIRGIDECSQHGKVLFAAGAGEYWDAFVGHTVKRNCGGLECLSGIPGTVGGTPVQNVGAYGQEVGETICQVKAFEIATGAVETLDNTACGFGYRTSVFNTSARGRYIILEATYALDRGGAPNIKYADLKKRFAQCAPTLAETRNAVRQIRQSKGMLLVDGYPDCRSAGSFFKNPVVTAAQYDELQRRVAERGLTIPTYPALASQHKVPAAWLVEQAGFHKGYSRGAAGISCKHALALVNRGSATAADFIALKNDIQNAVREQFGIELHPEPVFVGLDES